MASIIKSAAMASKIIRDILDMRKVIDDKKDLQLAALDFGARALEKANANGEGFFHEAAIVRYHANNKAAVLIPIEHHTREALKAAVSVLEKMAQQEAGECDD